MSEAAAAVIVGLLSLVGTIFTALIALSVRRATRPANGGSLGTDLERIEGKVDETREALTFHVTTHHFREAPHD